MTYPCIKYSLVYIIFNVDRFLCYLLRVKKNTPVILSLLLCCAGGGLAMGVPESVIGQNSQEW